MIQQKTLENGFQYIDITNNAASASIALQGAHLFHYCRNGERPLLWLSKKSLMEQGKAIRGGIPVCWPWFGPHPDDSSLPQHGFARTSMWEMAGSEETDPAASSVILRLTDSEASRMLWPFHFELELKINIGNTLSAALTTRNIDTRAFTITSALHAYLNVSDIRQVEIEGLEGTRCFDKVSSQKYNVDSPLRINQEFDRVFQNVHYPILLRDADRTVKIHGHGSNSAIVWNPWKEKCAAMADMPRNGYKTMVCVEVANALDDARTIEPGKTHCLKAIFA